MTPQQLAGTNNHLHLRELECLWNSLDMETRRECYDILHKNEYVGITFRLEPSTRQVQFRYWWFVRSHQYDLRKKSCELILTWSDKQMRNYFETNMGEPWS